MEQYLEFSAQILADKPLTIVGNGNQKRDFTYVSDVISAITKVLKKIFVRRSIKCG